MRAPGGGSSGITPGALCCRSGFPPIPAETPEFTLSRSPLTVLLPPQVQNYSVARLRLILADLTALATQQFRGSSQWAGGINWREVPPTLTIGSGKC